MSGPRSSTRLPSIGITCYPSQGGSGIVATELGLNLARSGYADIGATSIDGLRYFFYEPGGEREVVGFSVLNDGSGKVNPVVPEAVCMVAARARRGAGADRTASRGNRPTAGSPGPDPGRNPGLNQAASPRMMCRVWVG